MYDLRRDAQPTRSRSRCARCSAKSCATIRPGAAATTSRAAGRAWACAWRASSARSRTARHEEWDQRFGRRRVAETAGQPGDFRAAVRGRVVPRAPGAAFRRRLRRQLLPVPVARHGPVRPRRARRRLARRGLREVRGVQRALVLGVRDGHALHDRPAARDRRAAAQGGQSTSNSTRSRRCRATTRSWSTSRDSSRRSRDFLSSRVESRPRLRRTRVPALLREQQRRIDHRPVDATPQCRCGPGHAAGRADQARARRLPAPRRPVFTSMRLRWQYIVTHALAVVDEHRVAVEEEIARLRRTRPAAGLRIGVPVGAAMSMPLCGLRGCPLKTRRLPYESRALARHGHGPAPGRRPALGVGGQGALGALASRRRCA